MTSRKIELGSLPPVDSKGTPYGANEAGIHPSFHPGSYLKWASERYPSKVGFLRHWGPHFKGEATDAMMLVASLSNSMPSLSKGDYLTPTGRWSRRSRSTSEAAGSSQLGCGTDSIAQVLWLVKHCFLRKDKMTLLRVASPSTSEDISSCLLEE